jgi:hypothetical protein
MQELGLVQGLVQGQGQVLELACMLGPELGHRKT